MLTPTVPAVVLAPMEGVTDAAMRAVQGEVGGFAFAVSEFLRVSQTVPPPHVFFRHVPELRSGATTPTGLPVQVQILGGDPGRMAAAAGVAVGCGATAIDINFGCPAPTVNRHDGGATLLKYPTRVRAIVRAVRDALPPKIPVSAKMRLGWDSTEAIDENAAMAVEGGAAWVTVHARTRVAGYAPPVDWRAVGRVRETLGVPVVANGDIWTLADFRRCRDESGCSHYMLGRGALANPRLARQVAAELGIAPPPAPVWDWRPLFERFLAWSAHYRGEVPGGAVRKLKQWLRIAANCGAFAGFDAVKRAATVDELFAALPVPESGDPRRRSTACLH